MINIIDFIPIGHENAVKYDFLKRVTGLSKRAVRKELSKARKEYIILGKTAKASSVLPRMRKT